jgi:hypothetical protein
MVESFISGGVDNDSNAEFNELSSKFIAFGPLTPISTVYELENMSSDLNASYYLTNDIDCTNTSDWDGYAGFKIVGNPFAAFNGSFDGKGYKIINLTINRSNTDYVGLFGYINSTVIIENVSLVTVNITGKEKTGSLIGKSNAGTISNCSVIGTVNGTINVGGMIGLNDGGSINNCSSTIDLIWTGGTYGGLVGWNSGTINNSHTTVNINVTGSYVGGLIGENKVTAKIDSCSSSGSVDSTGGEVGGLVGNNVGYINNSHYIGNVSGTANNVGGLVGYNEDGIIENCTSTGNVTAASNYIGGLVGYNEKTSVAGIIKYSSFSGVVDADNSVGGLVGINDGGIIEECYSSGIVNGSANEVGGLVGENQGTINNSYSYSDVNGSGQNIGGLVGYISGPLSNSFYIGNVKGSDYVGGLFGAGMLTNMNIINCSAEGSVVGNNYVGGLVGSADAVVSSKFINCSSSASASGADYVGGLVGRLGAGGVTEFDRCYSSGVVYGTGNGTGGLLGDSGLGGKILNSYSSAEVDGNWSVGGLVGFGGISFEIDNCSSSGDVLGNWSVGGLVGYFFGNSVNNSHSSSFVNGTGLNVGGFIGFNNKGSIDNSSSENDVMGHDDYVGGLIGYNNGGHLHNTSHTGDVIGYGDNVGGLAGVNFVDISRSFSIGDVSGNNLTGGLVGTNYGTINATYSIAMVLSSNTVTGTTAGGLVAFNMGAISNSSSSGTVKSNGGPSGGLVGNNSGFVNNSYSTSSGIQGFLYTGGLVGYHSGNIKNCYSVGTVTGGNTGGFVGWNDSGAINNSFWDKDSSGLINGAGLGSFDGVSGNTTEEMMNKTTFTNASWNFTEIWNIVSNETYPYFRWRFETPPKIISGYIYQDWGITKVGGGKQINVGLNGQKMISSTYADGRYLVLVDNNTFNKNIPIVSYIVGDSIKGSAMMLSGNDSIWDLDIYGSNVGGNILVRSQINSAVKNTDLLEAKGTISDTDILFGGSGSDLQINSGVHFYTLDDYEINGNIISQGSGILNFNAPAIVSNDITLSGTSVKLNSTLNGSYNLIITGNAVIGGDIGTENSLSSLKVTGTALLINGDRIISADKTVFEKSLTGNTGGFTLNGNVELNTDVTTSGDQIYNGTVTLLNGDRILTGTKMTFKADVSNSGGGLVINGQAELGGDISVTGHQQYKNAVTLISDVKLSMWSDLIFENLLDGSFNLTINAWSGNINFLGNVGNFERLGVIKIESAYNLTNLGTLKASSFIQSLGIGTTNFSIGVLDLDTGSASITANNVVGSLFVGALSLGTTNANVTGFIGGEGGLAGAKNIKLLKLIKMDTNFFDGHDLFRFGPEDVTIAYEDTFYRVVYDAKYPDEEILGYHIDTKASWLLITPDTGVLSGTPSNSDVGFWDINVTVTDSQSHSSTHSFNITVINTNDPPHITSVPEATAIEGTPYIYEVNAVDDDLVHGDSLSFKLDVFPSGMGIDTTTGLIYWSPTEPQTNRDHIVIVNVTDGEAYTLQAFKVTVFAINDAPVIISSPILTVLEDLQYTYEVQVQDDGLPSSGAIKYKLDTFPAGMTIHSTNGIIKWLPTNDNANKDYLVKVNVTDGELFITQQFSVTVINVNDPPKIVTADVNYAMEDSFYNVDYDAVDIDPVNDILIWSVDTIAGWLKIDPVTGNLSGTPTNDDVGNYLVTVTVMDVKDGSDQNSFLLIVRNLNDEPVWKDVPDHMNATEGTDLTLSAQASDVDVGDVITYGITSAPNSDIVINAETGIITWDNITFGDYVIKITATDGIQSIWHVFTISVAKKPVITPPDTDNNPPIIDQITQTQQATAGKTFKMTISGSDFDRDDKDNLVFNLSQAPAGMVISKDGVIIWTPDDNQVGGYTIKVSLTDGKNSTSTSFNITVQEAEEDKPEDKEEGEAVSMESLNAAYGAIAVLIILLIILIYLLFVRYKARPGEEMGEERGRAKVVEEEVEAFKCADCGEIIHMGDSECPGCGMEFSDEDFDDAVDQDEWEE